MVSALGAIPGQYGEQVIDLTPKPLAQSGEGFDIVWVDDETAVVDLDPGSAQPAAIDPGDHGQNLAEVLDASVLVTLADRVLDTVAQDIESRKEWQERLAEGIQRMGVSEDKSPGPFPGASAAVHPMLAEACVQFQARAIAELWPSGGPVKGVVFGEADDELQERRERGEDYMNYQYTSEMPEAFWEMDTLLFRLPLEGSCFKKVYVNATMGRISQGMVTADDLIVPYSASSLATAPWYTHRIRYYQNEMRKLQVSGFYVEANLGEPNDDADRTSVDDEIDEAEGKSPNDLREDRQFVVYEQYLDYDLPGFEDIDPETGEATGIGLPYIVTVERDTKQVLAVRRNWKQGDIYRTKRNFFVHYKFLPGFGFYGFGFLHTIGGLSKSATGALRALLDAAQLANLRGGFKSKEARIPGGSTTFAPGEWVDTDMSPEEMQKAFLPMKYGEPSTVLFQLLGALVEFGQRFASTTEAMVGDADNNGPVGTTVALIEQGSKVFSGIHKRLHHAQGEEFKLVSELNYEILPPDQAYPYRLSGNEKHVIRDDFDGRVDWAPVSDPNIFSSSQRIAQGQAVLQLTKEAPELYDKYEAHKRMLDALKIPDPDQLLPDPDQTERLDPMSENMAILHGKPIRAYYDQDHEAHLQVLMQWFGTLPEEAQKMFKGSVYAHAAEHLAYGYRMQIEQQVGAIPYHPEFHGRKGEKMLKSELPPELDAQVARAAAQASQNLKSLMPGSGDKESPAAAAAKAEAARKDALAQADIARKDQLAQSDQQRKDAALQAELARDDAETAADIQRKDIELRARLAAQDMQTRERVGGQHHDAR